MKWKWALFLLVFIGYSYVSASLDLTISRYFYSDGDFSNPPYFAFLYKYGILPGWILAVLSLIIFFLSLFIARLEKYRKPAFFLVLTLAIGSGLIVHALLKDHWGRPRPRQIIEFNGHQDFRPFYKPNFQTIEPSKSFPCGHCTMGYYFFALAFLGLYYRNIKLYRWGLFLALFLGSLLGLMRISQGGHFFSDVLFSGIIMWLTAWILYRLILYQNKT